MKIDFAAAKSLKQPLFAVFLGHPKSQFEEVMNHWAASRRKLPEQAATPFTPSQSDPSPAIDHLRVGSADPEPIQLSEGSAQRLPTPAIATKPQGLSAGQTREQDPAPPNFIGNLDQTKASEPSEPSLPPESFRAPLAQAQQLSQSSRSAQQVEPFGHTQVAGRAPSSTVADQGVARTVEHLVQLARHRAFGFLEPGVLGLGGGGGDAGRSTSIPSVEAPANELPPGQAVGSTPAKPVPGRSLSPGPGGVRIPGGDIAPEGLGASPSKDQSQSPFLEGDALSILDGARPTAQVRLVGGRYSPAISATRTSRNHTLGNLLEMKAMASRESDLSLMVHEREGVVQIIAAAPALEQSEAPRLRKAIAEVAAEFGLGLGDLALNGAPFEDSTGRTNGVSHGNRAR